MKVVSCVSINPHGFSNLSHIEGKMKSTYFEWTDYDVTDGLGAKCTAFFFFFFKVCPLLYKHLTM